MSNIAKGQLDAAIQTTLKVSAVPLSTEKITTEQQASQPTHDFIYPATVKVVMEHGSPLVALLLLIWLFRELTRFVRVLKED